MAKTHTTLDLDRDLLDRAAEALGTRRTTDTVHAALREVIARRQRAWLAGLSQAIGTRPAASSANLPLVARFTIVRSTSLIS